MPFEDDRLRMQREKDGTYTVQLPGIWVEREYGSPQTAMKVAEAHLNSRESSDNQLRKAKLAGMQKERRDLLALLDTVNDKILEAQHKMESYASDSEALIDAGFDAIEAFDFDNRFTKKYGKPTLVFVTPWDTDRDGVVEHGEFEICYGWGRYNMPESEGE